jgi:hypothetical protein
MIEIAHARSTDPHTSHEAAMIVSPHINQLQRRVLTYAAKYPKTGFLDLTMEEELGSHGSTYRTRRAELTSLGLIRDSGMVDRAPGDRRDRIVWIITARGLAAMKKD